MMYSDVVMEKAQGHTSKNGIDIREELESVLAEYKKSKDIYDDTELTAEDLKFLSSIFKKHIHSNLGKAFPIILMTS